MRTVRQDVLDCIGGTSLVPLRRIVPANGARILVKIESENPTGSMKDRMALAMIEAAESLGYTRSQIYWQIVLPLAVRNALPALGNNLVNLVKTTNLAYAIAVPELMYAAKQIWSDATNVREMMILLLFVYVGLVALLVLGLNALERALRIPGYGQAGQR